MRYLSLKTGFIIEACLLEEHIRKIIYIELEFLIFCSRTHTLMSQIFWKLEIFNLMKAANQFQNNV